MRVFRKRFLRMGSSAVGSVCLSNARGLHVDPTFSFGRPDRDTAHAVRGLGVLAPPRHARDQGVGTRVIRSPAPRHAVLVPHDVPHRLAPEPHQVRRDEVFPRPHSHGRLRRHRRQNEQVKHAVTLAIRKTCLTGFREVFVVN